MNAENNEFSPSKSYLRQLLNGHPAKYNNAKKIITQAASKVEFQIESGSINIEKRSYDSIVSNKYRKEMQNINSQLKLNEEEYKKAKKQLVKQRKIETEEQKTMHEEKKKEIEEKIKKWTQIRKKLKERREELKREKELRQEEEEERKEAEQEERKQAEQQEKKRRIQQRLRQLQENKEKREEIIRHSSVEAKHLYPKYLQMEKKFKQYEEQLKFQEAIAKKNHKLSLKIDHEKIKAHEKQFIQKLSQRKALEKQSNSPSSVKQTQREEGFKPFFSKDEQKIQAEKEKLKRRKEYQQKIKQIPVSIDEGKKVQVQIEIDKGKNRKKYNFLGQKALNDFQIYGQFHDFQINLDPKQIGNSYLKELPAINQSSRVQRSRSTNTLDEKYKTQKPKYIDYLSELKSQRTQRTFKSDDQIQDILRSHKQKEKIVQQLHNRMKKYEQQAKKKMEDSEKSKGINSLMKSSKQVDDIYLKSIKAKLACLQMQL